MDFEEAAPRIREGLEQRRSRELRTSIRHRVIKDLEVRVLEGEDH